MAKKEEVSARDFLATRKEGAKFNVGSRKKIEFVKDFGRFKMGHVTDLFEEKADYYVSKGIAKLVK